MTSFYDVLDGLRAVALDEHDKGMRFENLVRRFMMTEPAFVQRFERVIPFSEWPGREDSRDRGVDLIGIQRVTGELCAIQCKFYGENDYIDQATIASFFVELGKKDFSSGIIVTTSINWSKNAEQALEDQVKPVQRIGLDHFTQADIDWASFSPESETLQRLPGKKLRPHQEEALAKVTEGLKTHDRGKLIMACGTGKTFTSLKTAESMLPNGGRVLFLVPSISLLSQTLREWTAECEQELRSFAVCSDTKIGKNKGENDDISSFDLAYPATTNAAKLVENVRRLTKDFAGLVVIFSTYQSLEVIHNAQSQGLSEFDLIICDEAHRTTGVTLADDEESAFVRVHDSNYILGSKRLYMTATPRVYGEAVKAKADQAEALLASMDDERLYGPEFHRLMFGEAVAQGLLSDYRVVTLSVSEEYVADKLADNQLNMLDLPLDDVARIIGCYNGLAKNADDIEHFIADPAPMKRAVAFAASIAQSKSFTKSAAEVVNDLLLTNDDDESVRLEVHHVDGTQNVLKRNSELEWLKSPGAPNTVRVLSNARCLSEGVDVPALDAVLFLSPRNSVVDVVQSVGRVMRRSEGKQYGYIIIPVAIPNFEDPVAALNDNKRYKTVWQVLQALRSHDERFAAMVNKIELNKALGGVAAFGGVGGKGDEDETVKDENAGIQKAFNLGELPQWGDAILAKLVSKVGQRNYWENWAGDVADIVQRFQSRIKSLVERGSEEQRSEFTRFVKGLQSVINPGVTEEAAIEMLAQHMVTKPVFDALFESYLFSDSNPVSQVMESMLVTLEGVNFDRETDNLQKFYGSVRTRVEGIDNSAGRQQVIKELYDKFFRGAFSVTADKLGIVYTPVEIVDFMIHAVEKVLQRSLGASLGDRGVHILDPFTGTGTFMSRLLESGIIPPEVREHKFRYEMHANEIVLLAYYIAAVNIEETFHGGHSNSYVAFDGLVLTDTFQMTESGWRNQLAGGAFIGNSDRAELQLSEPIQVIISNPPYSVGQTREGDGDSNERYPDLDKRVSESYKARSSTTMTKALDDSYIRAFRWATDRVGDQGVICFVSGGGWLSGNAMDGMRRSLADEFAEIYVLDLRGNARTQGEKRRAEGGGVFGDGSQTPITVTLLVKKRGHTGPAKIFYHDIGSYLSREQKLAKVVEMISNEPHWSEIVPNEFADWINQRRNDFHELAPLVDADNKGRESEAIFTLFSSGVTTNRDAWAYSFSPLTLKESMETAIQTYEEVRNMTASGGNPKLVPQDETRIKWDQGVRTRLAKNLPASLDMSAFRSAMYRPFVKQFMYFDPMWNWSRYKLPSVFPAGQATPRVIVVSGVGSSSDFSCLITTSVPNKHLLDTDQVLPEFWFKESKNQTGLFAGQDEGLTRKEGISSWAVSRISAIVGRPVAREEIFNYVYGILHSQQFRQTYADNLVKERPRIPLPADGDSFRAFCEAGEALSNLHLNYEQVEPYPLTESCSRPDLDPAQLYRVKKMILPKGSTVKDSPDTIIYNEYITLSGIPEEAWDYVLSGKAALYWILDRYRVTRDKDSGITNDPNEFSEDPRYILDLVKRIVTVSVETLKIVRELPELTFD
jgi:predicted helicase